MEEMGIEQIHLDHSGEHPNAENLQLKHYDSLDHHDAVNDVFSKSFDMRSIKLDTESQTSNLNRSSIFDLKERTTQESSKNIVHANDHHNFMHNHSHDHKISSNLNVRAAAIHILGDIIQSVGVLIAALIIFVFPDWDIIDPI